MTGFKRNFRRKRQQRPRRRMARRTRRTRRGAPRRNKINYGTFRATSSGFPEVLYTKLSYFENNYSFSIPANADSNQLAITANSPYDPYPYTGGKSALYYQTYAQIYRFCRVMAAKIKVSINLTDDALVPSLLAVLPFYDPSSTSIPFFGNGIDDLGPTMRAKVKRVNPTRVGNTVRISYYIPIHTACQMTKLQYMSQLPGSGFDIINNQSGSVSNPSRLVYFMIMTSRTTPGAAVIHLEGTVSVKYYCKFYTKHYKAEAGPTVDAEGVTGLYEFDKTNVFVNSNIGVTGTVAPII